MLIKNSQHSGGWGKKKFSTFRKGASQYPRMSVKTFVTELNNSQWQTYNYKLTVTQCI